MTAREQKVIEAFEAVFTAKGIRAPILCPETLLDGSLGLESLDFAEVVIRLEEMTGKDPFCEASVSEVHTISDLAALY